MSLLWILFRDMFLSVTNEGLLACNFSRCELQSQILLKGITCTSGSGNRIWRLYLQTRVKLISDKDVGITDTRQVCAIAYTFIHYFSITRFSVAGVLICTAFWAKHGTAFMGWDHHDCMSNLQMHLSNTSSRVHSRSFQKYWLHKIHITV